MVNPQVHEPPPSGNRGRVAKNASIYMASQIITWLVTFVSLSIIPRLLGEKTLGEMTFITALTASVVGFFSFGIDSYMTKEIGRDSRQAERLLRATFGLRLAVSIPTLAIIWAFIASKHPDRLLWLLLGFTVVGTPIAYLITALRAVFAGSERAKQVVTLDIIGVAMPLLALPLLSAQDSFRSVVALSIVGLLGALLGLFTPLWWLRDSMRLRPVVDFKIWAELIRGGLPFLVNNFVLSLYASVTALQLQHYADFESVGVYGQAQKLFGTFLFVPTALGAALLPSLTRMAQASPPEFRRMQARVLGLLIVLGLPVTASVMLLARPISLLLYGPDRFVTMPLTLQVYALVVIPMYIVSTMYQFLVAQNRNGMWSAFLLATVGLYALASMFLIPFFHDHYHAGAIGAVSATLIAETCSTIFAFILLKNNPFDAETIGRVFRALLATAAMGLVMVSIRQGFTRLPVRLQLAPPILLIELVLCATLGIATFAVLGWVLRILTEEEQTKISETVRRKLGR